MANRMKEDEKNEKIIRGLLKLPANRRCINCNNLGPQYVCTNFWTFICTNCSGVHREFTHRVKSVSMAKFTSQEVSALQEGGNEHARGIYFKEWDPHRHSFADSSNIDRLRNFIKHVYVDRRFTAERNVDRPPRMKGVREDYNENRKMESYRNDSRSPPYDLGRNGDRNLRYSYGEQSPGYDRGDHRRSSARFEVVDDRLRDDRFGNGNQNWRFEDRRLPDAPKSEGRSPNHQKHVNVTNPPMIRPVKGVLGDDMPAIGVGDPPKSNEASCDNSAQTQGTSSSSSPGSTDGNSVQLKRANSGNLISFSADPVPPAAEAPQQAVRQETASPSSGGGDWASFDVTGQQEAPQVVANVNTLESALAQLSIPESASVGNMSTLPVPGVDSSPKTQDGAQLPMMQQQQPLLFPVAGSQSINQPSSLSAVGSPNNQICSSSPALNMPGSLSAPAGAPPGHLSQIVIKPPQETNAGVSSEPSSADSKTSGRKELPEDLFTSLFSTASLSPSGYLRGPQLGMGYGMQYPTGMIVPAYPQLVKSANPFDLTNEPAPLSAPMFPSMASLQGSIPNMSVPRNLLRSCSFGGPSPRQMPSQQPSYLSSISPSLYMMQQVPSNMRHHVPTNMVPMVHQGIVGLGSEGAAFGSIGIDHHPAGRYSLPSTPNSFSPAGGNPFG
ncbi:probable ADP-ribosylation factor GTPase-activating protein AGD14 isoform X2 [Phoenix dactylifera]|uniref:Probable ADP-ribosylation factor GTPase-activating protein AGD14 isoform X2 n=1 Tax=Phoenix dactylifera TaxID=42345 RepID=A0A8B7C7J9_PHODC|nr:probable ADP-ribosylation factor GTPase-activating protein AGD14 isoform X2 [Phoenix dactylifera]